MIKIVEGKQVGPVSYCVSIESPSVLYDILKYNRIRKSRKTEYNVDRKQNQHYISFSRDLTSHAKKDPKKWGIGVILDGDKLSDKYSLRPISYTNNTFLRDNFYLRDLNSYDNGTYTATFTNFATMQIDKKCFENFEDIVLNLSEEDIKTFGVIFRGPGAKRYNRKRIKGYHINGPHALKINKNNVSDYVINYISKHTNLNETEERIWGIESDYINIANAVKGIILPQAWKFEYENPDVDTELGSILYRIKEFNYPVLWY